MDILRKIFGFFSIICRSMLMSSVTLPKSIAAIRFGLLSPDEIRKMSVQRVINADTFDEDGSPIHQGLMDVSLGTIDPGTRCSTCGNRMGGCPGHFGHIELQRPIIHVGFNKTIYKILQVICRKCSRIMLKSKEISRKAKDLRETKEQTEIFDMAMIEEIWKKAKRNRDQLINPKKHDDNELQGCYHCGEFQHKVRLEKPTTYYEEYETAQGNKVNDKLTALDVLNRLKAIPDDDALLLGVDTNHARPEWMVLEVLPVPPVCVRPSITLDSGIRSEDDLTHKLVDIIRINQRLFDNRESGAPQLIVEDLWELLQYHVTTLIDNEVSGIPPARHRSGRALRTLTQRLKGKEGRFRSNLSGKRVDFSARTVVSPDPLLSINQVGVPKEIAEILTVPERVTEWNIEEMKELVMQGPQGDPGVNYIIRDDGRRVDLRFARDPKIISDSLRPGFIIERHLSDGDIVLFNRQPSLHRMSIMAHEVKVMPYKTFRLNLCVCRPYNADFDGDEMNLHVPQSEEARAEAHILMKVQEQISTPRYGGPIIGAIQDFITGAYFLTRSDTILERRIACEYLTAAGITDIPEPDRDDEQGNPMWSGRSLFSTLLPKGMNFQMRNKFCECKEKQPDGKCLKEKCPTDGYVIIRNGKLISGVIDKSGFGAEVPNSVLHRILKEFGADATRFFLDGVTKMLIAHITRRGFSMGIDAVELPKLARKRISQGITDHKEAVDKLIVKYRKKELERIPGNTLEETLEVHVQNELSKARDEAGKVSAEYLGGNNSAVIMAKTGARGNMLNLSQMSACVGQQSVRGNRIERGYKGRTLPHFLVDDLSADAKGFVVSSFRSGLTPIEFFMHACGGREGLVDTAVRTSSSGYMQRRLVNAMQDLSSHYDKTIRNSTGEVIQFVFGDDNIDPAKSDNGNAVNVDVILEKVLDGQS
jgi:DNA-directed RNA polymerase subunit A'